MARLETTVTVELKVSPAFLDFIEKATRETVAGYYLAKEKTAQDFLRRVRTHRLNVYIVRRRAGCEWVDEFRTYKPRGWVAPLP